MMNPPVLLCVLEAVRSAVPVLRAGTAGLRLSDVLWPKRIHIGESEGQSVGV